VELRNGLRNEGYKGKLNACYTLFIYSRPTILFEWLQPSHGELFVVRSNVKG